MSERPCDICKRPRWDGGHALNVRECQTSGSELCLLWRVVGVARKIAATSTGGTDIDELHGALGALAGLR